MTDSIYRKLADVLDSLPNGFPRSESGIEIELLKKVFEPAEAELFCELRLHKETAGEIAARTGRDAETLARELDAMWERGLLECDPGGAERRYGLVPWILGLYELQLNRIDAEFARLHAKYIKSVGPFFLSHSPQMMQVVPIEKQLSPDHSPMPYEQVSSIIEKSASFAVNECICKKQTSLLNRGCAKPREVCLAVSETPGYFDHHPLVGRVITKREAYDILRMAEEAGLVHMTGNTRKGHFFICNCCGCCCVQLIAARFGIPQTVNAHYYAVVDPALCKNCGTCETRCQVAAVVRGETSSINAAKCIGCGLCVSTCPEGAIRLVRKPEAQQVVPPEDDMDWYRKKAESQGKDISRWE